MYSIHLYPWDGIAQEGAKFDLHSAPSVSRGVSASAGCCTRREDWPRSCSACWTTGLMYHECKGNVTNNNEIRGKNHEKPWFSMIWFPRINPFRSVAVTAINGPFQLLQDLGWSQRSVNVHGCSFKILPAIFEMMCVYIHTIMYIYIHVYSIHKCIYIYICIYIHVYIYITICAIICL